MISQEQLKNQIGNLQVPGVLRRLDRMNMLRDVKFTGSKAEVSVASTAMGEQAQFWLKGAVTNMVTKQDGIDEAEVTLVDIKPKEINEIKNVIAVMSGKGGVGKSLVSGLIAISLQKSGLEVGILDADITGPSIPKIFGITQRPMGSESGIMPVLSESGIELMSVNLLLPNENEAVIWRGPMISNAITQFWEEVVWGKLDYLIVDLPPGTADAPMTVLQKLPVTGVIIVLTPQSLTSMVVRKAVNMAKRMQKPIIGIIENMSYLYVPEINKKYEVFGKSNAADIADQAAAPLLAEIPIDPALAKLCDAGQIETYDNDIITELGDAVIKAQPYSR